MLKNIYILLLFLLYSTSYSQNLIPNPGFDSVTGCPFYTGQIYKIVSWFSPVNHNGSADYFNTCALDSTVLIPNNWYGSENAATGNVYIGLALILYSVPNFREYIEVQLTSTMIAGKKYVVSFKYSLSDKSIYATDKFGIYFSALPTVGAGNWNPINVTPQLTSPCILNNKNGWTIVSFNYTASGNERYALFGNFLNDSLTSPTYLGNFEHNDSYLYLDDISIFPDSSRNLGNDTTLCPGDTLILDATTTGGSYLWQDNSTNPTYKVTHAGTYWVEVTVNYRINNMAITVMYDSFPTVNLGNDTTLCQGQSITLNGGLADSYLWSNSSTTSSIIVSTSGTYWVQANNGHCSTKDFINISFNTSPDINLGGDTILCQGKILILDVTNADATYLWQDSSTDPTYNVTQAGTYWVKVTNNCGTNTDTLVVKDKNCKCILYIPNSFTPNKDNLNDKFSPITDCSFSEYHFMIFNCWGEEIFDTYSSAVSWDGTYKGKIAPIGVYMYLVIYKFEKESRNTKSGNVNLIR